MNVTQPLSFVPVLLNLTGGNGTNVTNTTNAPHAAPHVSHEGGVLNGVKPLQENISLTIIQILLILLLSRFLAFLVQKLNQPRVIAEVIAGILLGPTACGNIPGFTAAIFPPDRIGYLKLLSDLGLIFFLFIVGLELDLNLLRKNAKKALFIAVVSMVFPFGVGAGIAIFLKTQVMSLVVPDGSVILFIGVAFAITAFPVLARILTETKILNTPVGMSTISAAAVGDAAAWCLLALTVAIVGAKDPITSLYIFLMLVAFCIIMALLSYFVFRRIKIPENPSENLVMFSLVVCLIAAWITDFIGVHAIFGAFIAGVSLPRKHGFAIHLTEKIEDLVTIILLPLYFAYSGLNTNVGLLNSGIAWAGVILVIGGACISKFTSATLAAKIVGMSWRECFTVGILMNTKGLVELIVLNIGLQNGVIDETVFSIMVLMALVTTFMTSPLVKCVYPHKYQQPKIVSEDTKISIGKAATQVPLGDLTSHLHLLVVIPPNPPMPLLMNIIQMFSKYYKKTSQNLLINTAQLIEVTDRYSSVIMASSAELGDDGGVHPFIQSISRIEGIKVANQKIISTAEHFHEDLVEIVYTEHLDALFFPWLVDLEEEEETAEIVSKLIEICPCTLGLLINSKLSDILNLSDAKILVPYTGGPDVREATELALSFGSEIHIQTFNESDYDEVDKTFLNQIDKLSDTDSSIVLTQTNKTTTDSFIETLKTDYIENSFSLLLVGRGKVESESENALAVLGGLGCRLLTQQFTGNMLVVVRGKSSSKFVNLALEDDE